MGALRWAACATLGLVMASFAGMLAWGGAARMVGWYLTLGVLPLLGAASLLGCLVRLAVARRAGLAWGLTLALSLAALVPSSWALRLWPVAYPVRLEDAGPALHIRVPTDVRMRVAWGGDSAAGNQHAITADQRWAYDLVVEPYFTGGRELSGFGCFGVPVVAPIAGEVVFVRDGLPDMTPGEMDVEHPFGNHVALRPAAGGHLMLAHLQRGSLRVKRGEQVEEGRVLGACGNSGNTSEPHVHVHYQRQHPDAVPINFADGLPLYFRDHTGPAMPVGGLAQRDGEVVAIGDHVEHVGPR